MLELISLTKNYGSLVAVNQLSLKISAELFVFLGPNGAGKTTTIKMMAGLLKPTSGQVTVHQFDLWKEPNLAKREIGLVLDTPFLYEKLTAREFLQFLADIYKIERPVAQKRIQQLFELFELENKADELIESYSFGMKRKCALCGALIHDPKVLLLDEPTSGLDPKSIRNIKQVLLELVKRGVTIFMSTHILEIAENMGDRLGIINKGELIACGTMAELRAKSHENKQSLEDIFLELTGGNEVADVLKYLET